MKVLLVDDEVLSLETMRKSISWDKYGVSELFTASNVADAKRIYEKEIVDLLLLDVEMPIENGLSFLAWIRCNYPDRKTKAVFLTCHAKFEYAKEAIALECVDYLLKPVTNADIEKMLRKVGILVQEMETNNRMINYGKQLYQEKCDVITSSENYMNSKQAVDQVKEYILNHLTERFLVEDLANLCHLNADYLNRVFKKVHGTSVNRFIINERMYLAKELIQNKGMSPTVVSELLCYESYANFVKMFKKVHGCPPSQIGYGDENDNVGKR